MKALTSIGLCLSRRKNEYAPVENNEYHEVKCGTVIYGVLYLGQIFSRPENIKPKLFGDWNEKTTIITAKTMTFELLTPFS